ncbi:MAG: SAM-dependent methyltransferase [Myxococcota bacterium]
MRASKGRAVVFFLGLVLLSPALLLGGILYALPILRRRGKVSGTAYEPLLGRLLYHGTGARPDPAAVALARHLPATRRAAPLLLRPVLWAARMSGYGPSGLEYPGPSPATPATLLAARTHFIDRAAAGALDEAEQVVILGAGWDTRAYGALGNETRRFFEVDAPATQAEKRRGLESARISTETVHFVACDFETTSWLDALVEAGFDRSRRTLVIWEGVTMYLRSEAVAATLDGVASLPVGSAVVFDYVGAEWLAGTFEGRAVGSAVRVFHGEPFVFALPLQPPRAQLRGLLEKRGLRLEEEWLSHPDGTDATSFYGIAWARVAPKPAAKRAT